MQRRRAYSAPLGTVNARHEECRCVAALARNASRMDARAGLRDRSNSSAAFVHRPGLAQGLRRGPVNRGRNRPQPRERSRIKLVPRHPGRLPDGQDFSLFINTLV
jgi:hypothetical protein